MPQNLVCAFSVSPQGLMFVPFTSPYFSSKMKMKWLKCPHHFQKMIFISCGCCELISQVFIYWLTKLFLQEQTCIIPSLTKIYPCKKHTERKKYFLHNIWAVMKVLSCSWYHNSELIHFPEYICLVFSLYLWYIL